MTTYIVVGMRFRKQNEIAAGKVLPLGSAVQLVPVDTNSASAWAVEVRRNGLLLGFLKEEHARAYRSLYGNSCNHAKINVKCEFYWKVVVENITEGWTEVQLNNNPCGEVYYSNTDSPLKLNPEYEAKFLQEESTLKTKEETKIMDTVKQIADKNVGAAKMAAVFEAGRIANNQATKFVAQKAPLMVRGYVDTPFGKIVLANLAQMAVTQFRPQDKRLAKLTEAMSVVAYQELIQTFDVEGFINELLDSEKVKQALSKLDETV